MDDLGTEFVTPFTVSCLYNLINTRQNRGLSTIVSTNLSNAELQKKYEDRIYSRIMGSGFKILYFEGYDYFDTFEALEKIEKRDVMEFIADMFREDNLSVSKIMPLGGEGDE
jgi:hypothetical protein